MKFVTKHVVWSPLPVTITRGTSSLLLKNEAEIGKKDSCPGYLEYNFKIPGTI
jgi:hypothetical protein